MKMPERAQHALDCIAIALAANLTKDSRTELIGKLLLRRFDERLLEELR